MSRTLPNGQCMRKGSPVTGAGMRVMQVIECETVIGDGSDADPHRGIREYFTLDGYYIATIDTWKQEQRAIQEYNRKRLEEELSYAQQNAKAIDVKQILSDLANQNQAEIAKRFINGGTPDPVAPLVEDDVLAEQEDSWQTKQAAQQLPAT